MLNVRIPGIDVRSFMNNQAVLRMVMNVHMAPGKFTTASLKDGQTLQTRLAGASGQLTVEKPANGGAVKIRSAGTAPTVIKADVLAGDNGVMHVLDGMLIPVRLPGLPSSGR